MKRFLRDKLPKSTSITENKYLRFLTPWLGHPHLWHMHRRSVARGVAIGLVTGLIPGPETRCNCSVLLRRVRIISADCVGCHDTIEDGLKSV